MNTNKSMRNKAFTSLPRQRGASLLEGIAYLGIAAIVVLGAVSLLTGAFTSAQSNRVAEEVVSIRTAVKKLYMGQSSGYGSGTDLMPVLVASKVLPSTISVASGATTATNSWGGAVTVIGNGGNQFDIAYAAVPQDACINILSGASGWSVISGGGGAVPAIPVTPAGAQGACAAGANLITWTSL